MFRTLNDEENNFPNNLDFDLYDSFSLFSKKEENFNNDELDKELEEKLFYITPTKNKYEKKEIKYNIQKHNNNKKKEKIENKFLNEVGNDNMYDSKKNNNNKFKVNLLSGSVYRKDSYYKYFKVNLWKYIKNKMNTYKNKCFSFYSRNNFSSPNYKYTGNPKEKDNLAFLSFKIKDIITLGKDKAKFNRQYNNELIINFIEKNERKTKDKSVYKELIKLLNENLEEVIVQFYDDEKELNKLKQNSKCIYFDKCYKRETGISLLEKYGFLKVLKKYE